jgi:DNA uptake protein ComE-like DNA-binding protein
MGDRDRIPALLTPPQRGVLIVLVLILSVVLLVRLYHNRAYVSDPQPASPARFDELADRLDPNTATWQELAVLPQIGEVRARAIVAYRQNALAQGQPLAFTREEDLMNISGIGPATVATLRPYLQFPPTQPATRSAR